MIFVNWKLWGKKQEQVIDLLPLATHFYWISTSGSPSGRDVNWISTDKIPAKPGDYVDYKIVGHPLVASIAAYNSSGNVIGYAKGNEDNKLISGTYTLPEGTVSITMTAGSSTWQPDLSKQQYALLYVI